MTRVGLTLHAPLLDVWPVFEVFALEEYDLSLIQWDRVYSILDVGSNVGSFALWAAGRTAARIIAYEPNPVAFRLLALNAAPLKGRIELRREALAGSRGERILYEGGYTATGSIAIRHDRFRQHRVRAVTLEDAISSIAAASVDLVKIDIEGAEREVFDRMDTSVLRRVRGAVIECHSDAAVNSVVGGLIRAGMSVGWEGEMAAAGSVLVAAWRR